MARTGIFFFGIGGVRSAYGMHINHLKKMQGAASTMYFMCLYI